MISPSGEAPAAPPLSYKGELARAMLMLAEDPARRFLGYGVVQGRAMGTMKGIDVRQMVETPVAENLMVGMATGMALHGIRPVVFIERCDFLLNAADALVNHLDKMSLISRGEFKPAAIIRVVVGNRTNGLQTGATHVQDFSEAFDSMLQTIPVVVLKKPEDIYGAYLAARDRILLNSISTVLFEYKDLM